jgi:hypothetical protein
MPPSAAETAVLVPEHAGTESTLCDNCLHPLDYHDSVASRYCAATGSSALTRGCVCKIPHAVG